MTSPYRLAPAPFLPALPTLDTTRCPGCGEEGLSVDDHTHSTAQRGGASTDLVGRMLRHTDGRRAERVYGRLDAVSAGRLLGCDTGVPDLAAEGHLVRRVRSLWARNGGET